MTETSNICCWDCSYFDNTNTCTFLNQFTTRDTKCFAELYKLVSVCESDNCELCSRLLNGCNGDRENQPKKLQIFPHAGQAKVLQSQAQNVAALAGSQSGKTELFPTILHREMLKMGNGSCIVVSPSYPLMDRKLVPTYRYYFEQLLGIGHWYEAKKKLIVNSGNFEWIFYFVSADNEEALESMTAKCAHLDEAGQDAFSLSAYEAVQRRVSGNNGRIFFSSALYNFGWLKSEVYDRWLHGDPNYEVINWDSIIRPGFSKTVWNNRKRTMPAWKFDMQLRGLYSRPAGQIYSDFDENIHLIKPFTIPQSWSWHVGIDPGAVHTGLVWVAEEPGLNKYYVVHSYIDESKITTKEHVKKAMRFPEYNRVIRWVGASRSEGQVRIDWSGEGIHVTEPEIINVESGIDKVISLLREHRLFIFNNPENTEAGINGEMSLKDEFVSYSRELDANGKTTDRIKDKNKYHKLDAIRYFAVGTGNAGDYSTPVVWQETHIPSFDNIPDILRSDDIPQFR